MVGDGPDWLRAQPLPETAREQVTVALAMIDALERQIHHRLCVRSPPRAGAPVPPRPPALRWALYEAAQAARRPTSPDREYYLQAAEQLGANRACLALARKLLKRC